MWLVENDAADLNPRLSRSVVRTCCCCWWLTMMMMMTMTIRTS